MFQNLCHALFLVAGGDEVRPCPRAFAMTTPVPAHSIMLRSFWLSPKHIVSPGSTPKRRARYSTAAPFVAAGSVISR